MINFEEAMSLIVNLASHCPLEAENILLKNADGRICSKNILSPEAVPSFNNSAMDGFAICSKDLTMASEENPIRVLIPSFIAAGDEISLITPKRQIIGAEIMTGAPVPDFFDAVIKIEDVEIHQGKTGFTDEIIIRSSIPKGNNIRKKGSDYQVDQIILQQGAMLRAESMMALASLGITEVVVFKKPRVAILSTGKELVPYETKDLKSGLIRNSTGIYLETALDHLGAIVKYTETISDNTQDFRNFVQQISEQDIDVLVTTGAVSMGKYDFIVSTLIEMGAEIIFHKVAVRPGKPVLLAKIKRTKKNPLVIFGMPGNPVASVVGFRFFLTAFFRELNKQKPEQALQLKLSQTTTKPEGLKCFFKARLEHSNDGFGVRSLPGQASYMVSPLVQANAWVLFPENGSEVIKDEHVFVYPLLPDQSFDLGDLV
ncbi:MAG: molybdopterin molybdotransferase MoeA [Pseudobdellovibrio sp.]